MRPSRPTPSPTRQRTTTPVIGDAVVRPGIAVPTPVQDTPHPSVPSETVRSLPIVIAAEAGAAVAARASSPTAVTRAPRTRAAESVAVMKRMTVPFWFRRPRRQRTSHQYLGRPAASTRLGQN